MRGCFCFRIMLIFQQTTSKLAYTDLNMDSINISEWGYTYFNPAFANYMNNMADSLHSPSYSIDEIVVWHQLAAEEQIPGKVVLLKKSGYLLIKPFITLPANESKALVEFRVPNDSVAVPKPGDFVTFRCNIGSLHKDSKGVPFAEDIKRVSAEDASQQARRLHQKFKIRSDERALRLEREQFEGKKAEFEQERALSKRWLEEQLDMIETRSQELRQQELALQQRKDDIAQQELELQRIESRIRHFVIAAQTQESTEDRPPSDFNELFDQWPALLHSVGHITTRDLLSEQSFLLSLMSCLYTGELLLLDGSVGVGKTSIVKRAVEVLTGVEDASDIVPVRPGWIDSTDLVGFYDPNHQEFQPGTFLTALRKAGARSRRLHIICLDELNLARIENYGADLLSCMEYRESRALPLYSLDIESRLRAELVQQVLTEDNALERVRALCRERLEKRVFPAQLALPDNAVIAGTLNSDETTYDISPKVIDRAFVVRLPSADLSNAIRTEEAYAGRQNCVIDKHDFRKAVEINMKANVDFDWLMERVVPFQEPLKFLGIPLGYRAKRDLETFASVARSVGLTNREVILKHFLLTKLLPRIRCQKNERTREQWQKLQSRLKSIQMADSTGVIENLERQWNDTSYYTVRYFDVVQ